MCDWRPVHSFYCYAIAPHEGSGRACSAHFLIVDSSLPKEFLDLLQASPVHQLIGTVEDGLPEEISLGLVETNCPCFRGPQVSFPGFGNPAAPILIIRLSFFIL